MKNLKRTYLLLAIVILIQLISGCTGGYSETDQPSAPVETTSEATAVQTTADDIATPVDFQPEDSETDDISPAASYFPLTDTKEELSLWTAMSNSLTGFYTSWGDIEPFQYYEELSGVHINFVEASSMAGNELFNIMIASGEYTDMVFMLTGRYAGGGAKALEDEVIITLEDLVQENAPDYWDVIFLDEQNRKDAYTDEGNILAVYGFSAEEPTRQGMLIRQDWLDELGLDVPVTFEEFEIVAAAFKVAYGCDAAILVDEKGLSQNSAFIGAFDTKGFIINAPADVYSGSEFYQIDGIVQCSFLDDGYRDFLAMMANWYKEGYYSSDWLSIMGFQDALLPYIMNDRSGIFYGSPSIATYVKENHENPNARLTAISEPVLNRGDVSHFQGSDSKRLTDVSISITTQCDDAVLAIRWINGFFTEEGIQLANWGVQGHAWEYGEDGNPQFTELLTNSDLNASIDTIMRLYTLLEFPTLRSNTAEFSLYSDDVLSLVDAWNRVEGDGSKLLPSGLSLTVDEISKFTNLASDYETYASEHISQFMVGEEDVMAMWDEFTDNIKSMGLNECIDIYQAALDRYNDR